MISVLKGRFISGMEQIDSSFEGWIYLNKRYWELNEA